MKRRFTKFAAPFAITLSALALSSAAPVAAQSETAEAATAAQAEFDAIGSLFGDMFGTADPLTPEQEARVPTAQAVVVKLFPEGTYARMMDETMAPMMDAMMGNLTGSPALSLMELTGLAPSGLAEVDEASVADAIELLDIDEVNTGPWIRNTLKVDKAENRDEGLEAIYKVMRPGEPPTEDTARIHPCARVD